MPERFHVQLGHVDRAKDSEGWVNLADSVLLPHEAVRLSGRFGVSVPRRIENGRFGRVRHYADHYGAAREEVFDLCRQASPVAYGHSTHATLCATVPHRRT